MKVSLCKTEYSATKWGTFADTTVGARGRFVSVETKIGTLMERSRNVKMSSGEELHDSFCKAKSWCPRLLVAGHCLI